MKPEYAAWIRENCPGSQSGLCHSKSEAMRKIFPELTLCRGYYISELDGMRGHWWLKTADGEIVDPTIAQFDAGSEGRYEEYDPQRHGPLPIGKCMNCGDEIFEESNPPSSGMCSTECATSFDLYLNDEIRRGP